MKLEVLDDADAVAQAAASAIAADARAAVAARGRYALAVSGGHTPWIMLRALGNEDVPWQKVRVYQVDERVAPAGDRIEIDIPARSIKLVVSDEELARRRAAMLEKGADAWKPAKPRPRNVTTALKAYAALTTSAARGAVREIPAALR